MKKICALALMILVLTLPAMASDAPQGVSVFTSGQDWQDHMSAEEKQISIVPPAMFLEEHQVVFRYSLQDFIKFMDHAVSRNQALGREDVSNIFVSTVYLLQPESRAQLERMEFEFLRGNYEAVAPRLSVYFPDQKQDV